MRIGSLFSGIGGLELGLEWSGLGETVFQVEKDPYCRRVLAKHWPEVPRFIDVSTVRGEDLPPCDLLCGGFPCQDISVAGKRVGLSGARSCLWAHFARIVEEISPRWVVVENVGHTAKRWVDAISSDLGRLGFSSLALPFSARMVGAPHVRSRVFVVAHPERIQLRKQQGRGWRSCGQDTPQPILLGEDERWQPLPSICRDDDGVSAWMDRRRLKALGNAVVPQCAEVVGHIIRELGA